MSNSPLVVYTKLSPHWRSRGGAEIDEVAIHVMAGNISIETCGAVFNGTTIASSNYGIGGDGRIALYVDEANRTVCTNSTAHDSRAITIEVANSVAAHPWPITDLAYASLIDLLVDICQRNPGIKRLRWLDDKSLLGQVDKQNMLPHRWFANKACPGDYLYDRFGQIAKEVNERLEDDDMVRYKKLSDIKEKEFHDIIEILMNAQVIKGDGSDPVGNDDVIDLSHDQVRNFVIEYRGGAFDRKLISMGMKPVVNI